MYKIKTFNESYVYALDKEVNKYLEDLDSDYQYVDIKFSTISDKYIALLIMNYIPKRKILLEKAK